ncbi:ethanol-active dehydrogenase/acetaldehyde-active reductase [Streptococcus thermophilus]|nr:ethanol-active dehydrogenase/acetaldehyde-active reductase [Streptococcus thermophilus]MCE2327892.1 ethanol-active dehydrogenase/acetaldehyde-active reductase [Streptococcus thermophilus]MCE2332745.1 ethanol-active dehydrogenase/acetaldehyde-active reductase [Streptococcus thermophilus]
MVVSVVETVPVDTAGKVFDQMEKGEIQGRKVLDFTK